MWLIPFVSHCLSYSDYFAQHPIFAISLLSSFCQSFMGFADVCVFCWRERPWRHIPGSDGTFFGSFVFWKCHAEEGWSRRESKAPGHMPSLAERSQSQSNAQLETGLLATLRRWSTSRKNSSPNASSITHSLHRPTMGQKRAFSGGVSRTKEAELAHERLKLEREDYERNRTSLDQRRESVANTLRAPPRKEWFDRNNSEDTIGVMSETSDGR
jgi:G protein-coupled receptor GPR1